MSDAERAAERRFGDRRRSRRAPSATEESWFGALGDEGHDETRDDNSPFGEPSLLSPSTTAATEFAPTGQRAEPDDHAVFDDSRFLSRTAAKVVEAGLAGSERIYRAFIAARAALGMALAAALAIGLHLPRDEALPGRGGVFCSAVHRTAYEQAHPSS